MCDQALCLSPPVYNMSGESVGGGDHQTPDSQGDEMGCLLGPPRAPLEDSCPSPTSLGPDPSWRGSGR